MTRPLNYDAGLRGPGQTRFPEEIKEWGRQMALTGTAQLTRAGQLDAGGAPKNTWSNVGSAFRARIDAVGTASSSDVEAGQLHEETTHIISCDHSVAVQPSDRIVMDGKKWSVNEIPDVTDPVVQRIEVKGVVG
jgi:hypothetical protein